MRLTRIAAFFALFLPALALGQAVDTYPTATTPLFGSERLLGGQCSSGTYPCGPNTTVNVTPLQIADFTASQGSNYGILFNNNGVIGGLTPGTVGQYCLSWSSLVAPPTLATCTGGGGSGTVTSVAITVPSWLSVSGSPITTSGTFALTGASSLTTHQVLGTGTGGTLALESLSAADIPAALSNTTSVNGTTVPASQTLLYSGSALGTPSSGNAANLTGLPISTGVSGLGTGIATFLASPTATNLGSAVTGAGLVAGTNVTITGTWPNQTITASATGSTAFSALTGSTNTTAAMLVGTGASLGTTGSGTIAATSAPLSGVSGLGTGVATALGQAASGSGGIALTTSPAFTTPNIGAATGTSLSVSGQLTSTVATGTAPLVVSSTTQVANLNAASLGGATFASPGSIGSTTAGSGAFTTLSASSTVSGAGFSTYLASPPAIGGTAAAAGSFTTLSASGTVSGTGFSTYLASPPAIGGTTAAAAHFTTIGATGQITSTLATGTAPFSVASTTQVANLNAASVGGYTLPCTVPTLVSGDYLTNNGSTCSWASVAGSGTINAALQYALPYYSASGSATTLSGLVSPTSGAGYYALRYDPTSSTAVAPTADQVGANVRSISGAASTDTALYSDVLGLVVHDAAGSASVTETLPTPTTLGNAHFAYNYCNDSSHIDTIAPTTYTIAVNGGTAGASITLAQGVCAQINVDPFNSSQWDAFTYGASSGGGSSPGGSTNAVQTNNGSGGFNGISLGAGTVLLGNAGAPTATSTPLVGVAGTTVGEYCMANATSGSLCIAPPTGALGSAVLTAPDATTTLAGLNINQQFTQANSFTNQITETYAPPLSSAAINITGAIRTGGTGTTTFPYIYYLPSGATAPTTFSTAGTLFGADFGSAYTGNVFDFYLNGTEEASLTAAGVLTVQSCTGCGSSGTGLSGMTAGQVPIAATATTVTSSKALAGSGAGITTGPTSSTSGDLPTFTGTAGQLQDSGTALSSLALLSTTVTYTANQTAGTSDNGKLVVMNCSSACAYTLPATQPSTSWSVRVTSIGSTLATIALGGSDTFNGSTSVPVLNKFRPLLVYANAGTSTDYEGDAPLVAGSGITATPASNGFTLAVASSLPSTTSVNGSTIPASATLLTSGGALGTPSSGVATNLTGTASGLSIGGNAATATALAASFLNSASSGTSVTPICATGQRVTVTTITATGNLTINDPTGCTEGQQILLKVTYTASITYTWATGSGGFHANSSNPGAIPTTSGGSSGVDFFAFYADAANSRFDYLAGAPAF